MATDDKQTTADRARSRLFGGAATPSVPPVPKREPKAPPTRTTPKKASSPAPRTRSAQEATPAPSAGTGASNYLGSGRYLYKGRETRKLSVYVSPELVPALKAAGASGKDPRGGDMSEILESLIREAGYGDE